jgi:hypothetical protein
MIPTIDYLYINPILQIFDCSDILIFYKGSRESAPTNNRKFTSDKRKQAQGKWAGARLRARVCGRAFAGERSACSLLSVRSAHSPWLQAFY